MANQWKNPYSWVPRAKELLQEGLSYREVARTVGVDRRHVARTLPGYGWTKSQGSAHGKVVRKLNREVGR